MVLSGVALVGMLGLAIFTYSNNEAVNNKIDDINAKNDDNKNLINGLVPDVTSICSVVRKTIIRHIQSL